jgi:mRNA-degrading endonuclease RelE of RelBE toxin-antitoxin system
VITVRLTGEVLDYLRKLPPQPRHAIRMAIIGLGKELGDIKPLTEELEGFHRLRVGSYRILFEYEMVSGEKIITCVFAGSRRWIYEVLQSRLAE